jgi:hypothetical protein
MLHTERKSTVIEREGGAIAIAGCVGAKSDDSKRAWSASKIFLPFAVRCTVSHMKKNIGSQEFWISPQEIKIVEMHYTNTILKKFVNKFQIPEYCRICFLELRTLLVYLRKGRKQFRRVPEPDPNLRRWIRIGIRIRVKAGSGSALLSKLRNFSGSN